MQNIVLAHGFNVRDSGKETTDKLLPYLKAYNIQQADYGFLGLVGVRLYNDNIAKLIAGMVNDSTTGIGHSNGCAILVDAAKQTDRIKRLILINPALDSDTEFPNSVEQITIICNSHDTTVKASKWLPWHVWGQMGKVGYTGENPLAVNYNSYVLFGVKGHSAVLQEKPQELVDFLQKVGKL